LTRGDVDDGVRFVMLPHNTKKDNKDEWKAACLQQVQENFENAVKLYEEVVNNVKADDKALAALKARLNKARKDAKANKGAILQGLTSYALYGSENKFNNVLTNEELNAVTAQELVDRIKNLNNYEQTVIYYGPTPVYNVVSQLKTLHQVPANFAVAAPAKTFKQEVPAKNQVLFADYDMVQAETRWIRNTETYNPEKTTMVNVFNNYFGGGMGSLVFQTIRESKALAYSTYGYYVQPTDLKKGTVCQIDGKPYRVVEYGQKVMGRGGSIVNVKLKNLITLPSKNCKLNSLPSFR
jgi:predicted Zn-dependent peptidase